MHLNPVRLLKHSAVLLLLAAAPSRGESVPVPGYETGYPNITQISGNLTGALDAKRRQQIPAQPVSLGQGTAPCITPVQAAENGVEVQKVQISAGFLEFINQLSHAKAIEESEKGFLKKYTAALARESGVRPFPALPATAGQNPWDVDTLNYQVGNFNQMAGGLIAVQLAHHYLGHCKKYSAQLTATAGEAVPISSVLTEKEWREAVMKGAKNALDCGYGIEGLKCVFESVSSLPTRPAWAACFVHAKADVSRINRDLTKLERDFFLVGK